MAHIPGGYTAADLAAYERQIAMSKIALMNSQAQRLGGATQPIYDATGYSAIATTQPPLYYQ